MKSNYLIPVILCGGKGSRLWPLSRSSFPKQYLSILDINGRSLLQETQIRLKKIKDIQDPILISNEEHRFLIAEQMREINVSPQSILLEPFGRNTAPAIVTAALKALEIGEDPSLLILSADHNIENKDQFAKVIEKGRIKASEGMIVTFGIIPHRPETGYGYIQSENKFDGGIEASPILKFFEKPDLNTAREFLKDKRYYWNSGIFLSKASTIIDEANKYSEGLTRLCKESLNADLYDLDFQRLKYESFKKCPNISFDKAIMEKTEIGMIIPLKAGWSDIGSWKTVWEVSKKDKKGNVLLGNVLNNSTKNCYIKSDNKLVVGIGIEDLIVVDTNDAVLIANKNETQKVKDIVEYLDKVGQPEGKYHQKIFRPWGSYTAITRGSGWQLKTIEVKPGGKLSLQLHHHRSEHWIVVKGTAEVQLNKESKILKENQSIDIAIGSKHRLSNPGKIPLILIEVQSGDYLGEDDIVRFEDIYGRENKI